MLAYKSCQGIEVRNDAKLCYQQKKITALVQTWLAPACIPERQHYILASKGWLVMTMSDLLCVCEQLFETS